LYTPLTPKDFAMLCITESGTGELPMKALTIALRVAKKTSNGISEPKRNKEAKVRRKA